MGVENDRTYFSHSAVIKNIKVNLLVASDCHYLYHWQRVQTRCVSSVEGTNTHTHIYYVHIHSYKSYSTFASKHIQKSTSIENIEFN